VADASWRGNTYSRQEGTFVTRLEDRVTRVEREVDEVRRLASGAHEDVANVQATLRAHIGSLEALRKTQVEHSKEMRRGFADVRAEFTDVRTEIADIRAEMIHGFTEMREGFTKINLGMSQMTALLNIAIGRDPATD
jgi:hypothetical protein